MSKYLLPCKCGNEVAVEIGQAGGQVHCPTCGQAVDVPPLRQLRHRPRADDQIDSARSAWGARQGVATAGLIFAFMLLVVALWNRLSEPSVPEFDPETRRQAVDEALKDLTPAQGWRMWVELYRPMAERGFALIENPHKPAIEQYIARRRFFQKTMLAAGVFCAAVAIAAILWPSKTR
jgi:hypothetical protein